MIPLEDFFRKPDKVMLRLSPGGTHLAYLEPYRRRLNVTVQDLKRWNKSQLRGKYLQPGQRLNLYVDLRQQSG